MWVLILLVLGGLAAVAVAGGRASQAPSQVHMRRSVQYRTRDGSAYYGFSIEQQRDGSFLPYIVSQPDYGQRSQGAHATHRLRDGQGRTFVCWSEPIRSEQEALRVAAAWADATQNYIKHGRHF